jgi:alpha-mannosidase
MLTDAKILHKLRQVVKAYTALRFEPVLAPECEYAETAQRLGTDPEGLDWHPAPAGTTWGDDGVTGWFRCRVSLPAACADRKVWVRFKCPQETLFLRDGEPWGVFDGNHPYVCLTTKGQAGTEYALAFEAYSGHNMPGTGPDDTGITVLPGSRRFDGVELALEREDVSGFVFDLMTLLGLVECLDDNSLRKAQVIAGLAEVYAAIYQGPTEVEEEQWRPLLGRAREIMAPLLAQTNGSTAPLMGILGHSHMDTAWLWPVAETWRKVARTSSSIANLMEQYPELIFIQSSPCHTESMRRLYPAVFEQIRRLVAEGRYEPNGGMWGEADCNLTGGEAMVRQFLFGQRWTRQWLNYTADTLWLPDVFGYSAALPQILRGVGIEFFCTTKMAWNDTTRFPFDTFHWQGIDGTQVLAHLNSMHCWPDPKTLTAHWNWVQHKDVQDRRLVAFGFGDGGGGPMHEMCEIARRVSDLEGCPRTRYTTVSDFMEGMRDDLGPRLPVWVGELYLEMHRGTLTSVAPIKKGNRRCELALRDAEMLCSLAALEGARYPGQDLHNLWETLLLNQFHDILPGSSIAQVNDQAISEFAQCLEGAERISEQALTNLVASAQKDGSALLLANTLNWERGGSLEVPVTASGLAPTDPDVQWQWVQSITGEDRLALAGVTVPSLGFKVLPLGEAGPAAKSPFTVTEDTVTTPYCTARFDAAGGIVSLVDCSGREWVASGGVLNALLIGEDLPSCYDNWEIERDQRLKMERETRLVRREVVADGPVQLRLRLEWELGAGSRVRQDVVFHGHSPLVEFDTEVDWHEQHRLLKSTFDLNVQTEAARHEIQYGHVERSTHQNLPQDRARFEVCCHKWSDLSDNGSGVALLNDCKYGISVEGNRLGLSLLKSGTHPDPRGDAGTHSFRYALLPHHEPFGVTSVVRPAYEFNVPLRGRRVAADTVGPATQIAVEGDSVILESAKWAEDGEALVLRLYEAGKRAACARIVLPEGVTRVWQANMLEEPQQELTWEGGHTVKVALGPLQIVTLRCELTGK